MYQYGNAVSTSLAVFTRNEKNKKWRCQFWVTKETSRKYCKIQQMLSDT